jgi:hypothetical protein
MTRRVAWLTALAAVFFLLGCSEAGSSKAQRPLVSQLSPEQRDAQTLGREIFELVDRALDYRGSHRGRPPASLRQMGVDSLTPSTVRRLTNFQREPVVTVSFRETRGRELISCRGTSQIVEEASVDGRYVLMCTARSGAQRPVEVVTAGEH